MTKMPGSRFNTLRAWTARLGLVMATTLLCAATVWAAPPDHGVLLHLDPAHAAQFAARHHVKLQRLSPDHTLYLATDGGRRDDQQLLNELSTDPDAGSPHANAVIKLGGAAQLDGGSTASVLNGGSTASVLNGGSTASVLNGDSFYGTQVPDQYVNQPAVSQVQAGASAHAFATGDDTVVALVDNGVDPLNPVLRHSIDRRGAYNFVNNTRDWSAYADVNCGAIAGLLDGGSTASVLNGGSTASVLNGGSTASVLNGGSTASVLNGGSTASVLNGGSTASVLNGLGCFVSDGGSTASVLNGGSTASVLNGGSTASVLNGGSTASVLNGTSTVFTLDTENTQFVLDGGSTASVLNGGSTASVLNGGSTASVLNSIPCPLPSSILDGGSTASVLNGGSTASVLNGGSTASVLNGGSTASVLNGGSTASVLNDLAQIIACYPDFGHGTAVAGLIHLVAPEAKILPITAFGADGTATAATVYEAITYAIDRHVNVINLSFSAPNTTPDIQDAIQDAVNAGITVVAAAGNSATSAAVYPASLPGVIGVGALDGTAANTTFPLASFSNFDPGPGQIVDADVAAPGVDLFTTFPGGGLVWAISTGTSFSTPLVSGEAALLAQTRLEGAATKADIDATSNPSVSGDSGGQVGHGLINITGALTQAPAAAPDADYHFNHGWR